MTISKKMKNKIENYEMKDLDSKKNKKVILGLSGGVDSTAAALLLQEKGYEVIGLYFDALGVDKDDEYCSCEGCGCESKSGGSGGASDQKAVSGSEGTASGGSFVKSGSERIAVSGSDGTASDGLIVVGNFDELASDGSSAAKMTNLINEGGSDEHALGVSSEVADSGRIAVSGSEGTTSVGSFVKSDSEQIAVSGSEGTASGGLIVVGNSDELASDGSLTAQMTNLINEGGSDEHALGGSSAGELTGRARAELAAKQLGIKFIYKDVSDAFNEIVIGNFCSEYMKGRTPNPCIICNPNVKFKVLLAAADEEGASYIATGHYADTYYDEEEDLWYIKRAANEKKDQSYMLYRLGQDVVSRLILPLNDAENKDQIREMARNRALKNADAKDSQEICFVDSDDNYKEYIRRCGFDTPKGKFVDSDGNILGEHQGILNYTIGQRKGLGIALGKPAFVIDIDSEKNQVVLGDNMDLFKTEVISSDNIICGVELKNLVDSAKLMGLVGQTEIENGEVVCIDQGCEAGGAGQVCQVCQVGLEDCEAGGTAPVCQVGLESRQVGDTGGTGCGSCDFDLGGTDDGSYGFDSDCAKCIGGFIGSEAVAAVCKASGIKAKIRYAARPAEASIEILADGRVKTVFEEPQRAATPGQSIVFYKDDLVIGGGFIDAK